MGSFTTIALDDRRTVQITTGYDDCDTYKLGDTIPWRPEFYWPGDSVDGVELGDGPPDAFVVIQNSVVMAVVSAPEDYDQRERLREELIARYPRIPPPREWWPEIAWERKAVQEAKAAKLRADYDAALAKATRAEQTQLAIDAVNEFTRAKMQEEGFLRKLFAEWEEVPELSALLTEALREEFAGWPTTGPCADMLGDAAYYRGGQVLEAAGISQKRLSWRIVREPVFAVIAERRLPDRGATKHV